LGGQSIVMRRLRRPRGAIAAGGRQLCGALAGRFLPDRSIYKTGETIYIQAFCWGEAGEKLIPVSLHPHAGRLTVTWDRGTRGDLQRCP
jgi:hypothetical protein